MSEKTKPTVEQKPEDTEAELTEEALESVAGGTGLNFVGGPVINTALSSAKKLETVPTVTPDAALPNKIGTLL